MGGGLAKSVLKSLAKRADDPQTHQQISNFLQNTPKEQWQQYASMAGLEVPEPYLDKLTGVCQKVTPKTIRRTVRSTKVVVYLVKFFRKLSKLIQKYKSLIVLALLLQWTKSAMLRPMPIDRAAAKRQAKAELKAAMKANRQQKKQQQQQVSKRR
mmetsp:Transcript_82339/g.238609  ORF Transcript_82339/g.238609 Transcript_82339/m.238609 type:complete len:155 (-) Transcript_82339:26-490(-)